VLRDKEVVGVFVRFRAPASTTNIAECEQCLVGLSGFFDSATFFVR
jgi:hypothetical protein